MVSKKKIQKEKEREKERETVDIYLPKGSHRSLWKQLTSKCAKDI